MSSRAALHALGGLTIRAPRLVHGAAGVLVPPLRRFGRSSFAPEHVRELLPELSPAQARRIARRSWADHVRAHLLHGAAMHDPGGRIQELLVDDGGLSELEGPVVLAFPHLGPMALVRPALWRVRGELVVVQLNDAPSEFPHITTYTTRGEGASTRALYAAVGALRSGRSVAIATDSPPRTLVVPWFARSVAFARGAFVLSRLAKVPIVPMVARWEGHRGRVVLGPRLGPFADEREGAEAYGAWLEGYLREAPTELIRRFVDPAFTAGPRPAAAPAAARAAPSR